MGELLTNRQAVELLGVTNSALQQMVRKNRLRVAATRPPAGGGKPQRHYDRDDIERIKAQREGKA